jgi:hypothetical protein
MKDQVTRLSGFLTMLFSTVANELGRETRFVKRTRCFSAAEFVRTLVLGWMANKEATIEDFAEDLNVTPAAVQQRMNQQGVNLMRKLLEKACAFFLAAEPVDLELTRRFSGIYVEDCTSIKLMASWSEEFPGCGGAEVGQGAAGWKALVRMEVTTGHLSGLAWGKGCENDLNFSRTLDDVPPGSLYLGDLGFWWPERLDQWTGRGVWWISRVPASTTLREHSDQDERENIAAFLSRQTADRVDQQVLLGEKAFAFRLVAVRCPKAVADAKKRKLRKKAKKQGRNVSPNQLVLCEWLVLVTNLPADEFSIEALWTLYRVRWQIELVFKRWKSVLGLGHSLARTNRFRELMELYAKLLGCLVAQWSSLLRAGLLTKLSVHQILKRVKRALRNLKEQWDESNPQNVDVILRQLVKRLEKLKPRPKRKKKPSTIELLENPALAFN